MIRVLVLFMVVSFLAAGCGGVDVYTFKKDRVDQKMKGNEGYIMGQRPSGPREARDPKRTIIGVDVDVSRFLEEEEAEEAEGTKPVTEKKQFVPVSKPKTIGQDTIGPPAKKVETKKLRPEKTETEEDWIK